MMEALSQALGADVFGVDLERLVGVALLVFARTVPLVFVAPWLGWRGTPGVVRVATAWVLTAAFVPLALANAPEFPGGWLPLSLMGVREVLVGAAFAVAASVPLYAMAWTGELVDRWRGSPADATAAGNPGPLGALYLGVAVVLFVLLGGHRLALAAFAEGLVTVPPGAGTSAASLTGFALGSARIVADALALMVAFLLPAAVAFVLLEVALGLHARLAPTLKLWMEAMPLRAATGIAIALLSLAALLPRLGPVFSRSIDSASELLQHLGG